MRNPAKSLTKVPGHFKVADIAVLIITRFMAEYPHVATNLRTSIGMSKESLAKQGHQYALEGELLLKLRKQLAYELGADLNDDSDMTELVSPLFAAWIAHAKDPDEPLARWLKSGAPAGITAQPECVGIFPESRAPPTQ